MSVIGWTKLLKMDTKEDAEVQEVNSASPVWVLQHLSEEAVRVAGDALHNVYPVTPNLRPLRPEPGLGQGHRRSQSDVVPAFNGRTNSFQRLKTRMQKAWKWGSNSQEEGNRRSFNPEVLANQKRQWYRLHSKSLVFYLNILIFYFCCKFHLVRTLFLCFLRW